MLVWFLVVIIAKVRLNIHRGHYTAVRKYEFYLHASGFYLQNLALFQLITNTI